MIYGEHRNLAGVAEPAHLLRLSDFPLEILSIDPTHIDLGSDGIVSAVVRPAKNPNITKVYPVDQLSNTTRAVLDPFFEKQREAIPDEELGVGTLRFDVTDGRVDVTKTPYSKIERAHGGYVYLGRVTLSNDAFSLLGGVEEPRVTYLEALKSFLPHRNAS